MTNKTSAPIIQQQELTSKCNDNCPMCYNPERAVASFEPREEDIKKNIAIAEISVQKGVMAVCPTGGELLLMGDHIFDILKIYRDAGCYTSINSNGRLITEKIAKKFKDAGLDSALISIHGVGAINDMVTGVRGSYEQRLRGIRLLHQHGVHTVPNFVAAKDNVHGLMDLGKVLLKEGITSMTVTPFLPSHGSPKHEPLLLGASEYRQMFDTILALRNEGIKIDSTLPIPPCVLIKFCPNDWEQYLEVHSPRVCMAGKSFGVIAPDAMFRSCIQAPYLPEYGGNMLTNYEESWEKANTWADMELIPEICVRCPGLSICGGGCRTGCMWDNNGSVSGTTMYIGEALTTQQAEVFKKRISYPAKGTYDELNATYELLPGIKTRKEKFGDTDVTIVFNPKNQSFTIVTDLLPDKGFKVKNTVTLTVLNTIGAIVSSKKEFIQNIVVVPANALLPRMGMDLKAPETCYCLRADTGEKYHF